MIRFIHISSLSIFMLATAMASHAQADDSNCGFSLSADEIEKVQWLQDFILDDGSRFLCAYAGTRFISKEDMLGQIVSWNEQHDTPPSMQIMHVSIPDSNEPICVLVLWSKRSVQTPHFRKKVSKIVREHCGSK